MICAAFRSLASDWHDRRITMLLALITTSILALGITAVVNGLNPIQALGAAILGTVAGWLLAALPIPGWIAVCAAATLGVATAFAATGGLGASLLEVGKDASALYPSLMRGIVYWPDIDFRPLMISLAKLGSSIAVLFARWFQWSGAWLGGRPAVDPVAALLSWIFVIWGSSSWAGWTMRRASLAWKAFLPAGILLSATLAFSGVAPTVLYWFLLALIPLAAMANHDMQHRDWQADDLKHRPSLRISLAVGSLAISLALVTVALLTQPFSIHRFVRWVESLRQAQDDRGPRIAEYLGVEQVPAQAVVDEASLQQLRSPGLPRQHLIGSGPELSNQTVMIVQTSDRDPDRPLLDPSEIIQQYYWRSNTYDDFNGQGWKTGPTEADHYDPGELLIETERPGHRLLTQEISLVRPLSGRAFSAGDVVTIDQPYTVEWRSPEDPFGARLETHPNRFRVASLVPEPSQAQLRLAGADYPAWVRNRYLNLPDSMSDRVFKLALELTATAATPYDRALSIEHYLRQIPYSLDVPTPPEDQELSDYFLFELQKGYCDYYATAMVMLARAAGLPARLAVGYLSGSYEPTQGAYVVTEADAHSWVEIYFPGYGWMEFEPTGGRPAIGRAGTTRASGSPDIDTFVESIDFTRTGVSAQAAETSKSAWQLLRGGLIGAAAVAALPMLVQRLRLRRLSVRELAVEIHAALRNEAVGLGIAADPGTTASELMEALTARLERPNGWPTRLEAMRPLASDLQFLLSSYTLLTHDRPDRLIRTKKTDLHRVWRKFHWQMRVLRYRDHIARYFG